MLLVVEEVAGWVVLGRRELGAEHHLVHMVVVVVGMRIGRREGGGAASWVGCGNSWKAGRLSACSACSWWLLLRVCAIVVVMKMSLDCEEVMMEGVGFVIECGIVI